MTEQHPGHHVDEGSEKQMGRRGILAWCGTLASAGLAWLAGASRAEATHLTTGTAAADNLALHVDSVNDGTQRTFLVADLAGLSPGVMFNGTGPFSIGLGDGMQGITRKNSGAGVRGRNSAPTGPGSGVIGEASASGVGVAGMSGVLFPVLPVGVGVYGQSTAESGIGIKGQIPTGSGEENTIAVAGLNLSSGGGGWGCYGYSAQGHGFVGGTGTAGGVGVVGGNNGIPGAYAGVFYGPMVVVGGPKSAAVPNADGGHRLLYCVESPESWFEDFGKARLERGCATVAIDPLFSAVADLSDYHVFLTPLGNTKGLHVADRTPTAFTVQEHDGGVGEIGFSWRIVAKRNDIVAERFAKVMLPKEPVPPAMPENAPVSAPRIHPAPKRKRATVAHSHTHKDEHKEAGPKK